MLDAIFIKTTMITVISIPLERDIFIVGRSQEKDIDLQSSTEANNEDNAELQSIARVQKYNQKA